MIDQKRINALKQSVDLASVIQSYGIELKQSGKSYKGYCPFHEDSKSPSLSVTPDKNLWQCFGCGSGGDVIDFIRKHDGISFKEAVAQLSGKESPTLQKQPVKKKRTKDEFELTPAHYKLLKRVAAFYHTAFTEDPRAMEYLADRGITNRQLFTDYRIGFANGTLLNVLPDDGETITQLKELGILNKKGKEHFYGCATFPLYDCNNNPVGMYGRKLSEFENDKSPYHLYLPGERKGIFNRQGAVSNTEIHLTESILDSLSLINAGITNTIPCYGTNGLTPEIINHLKTQKITTAYISFDADEAGRTGAEKVAATLQQANITTCPVQLPDGCDLNNFFHPEVKNPENSISYEDLILIAAGHEPTPKEDNSSKEPECEYKYKKTENGFSFSIDGRYYEVRGITKKNNKLKATVKGIKKERSTGKSKSNNRFHVDTVDFYSARSRAYLIRGLADLFGAEETIISRDMEQLLVYAEQYQPPEKNPQEEKEKTLSSKEKQESLRFLQDPNLLDNIIGDIETIGYTGEEMNKLLCYLAAVSRKMSDPLSVMIQSRSAAGKSCLQDTILSLIPAEETIKYTRLTDQALFYKEQGSLAHKILAIEELDGMTGAIYSIRTIQSSKKITVAYTGKDPLTGEMKTGENTVEGPLMVFITTTQIEIDGETASRFVFISIDESREMTEKILSKQRESHTMAGMMNKLAAKKIIKKHLAAQQLLKPVRVINPYCDLLRFDSKSLRARRDHMKYLNLILTITFLFQYQRPVHTMDYDGEKEDYILVTLGDIEKANEIATEVLGRSLDELSPSSRKLLNLIREMCVSEGREQETEDNNKEPKRFTRRDIREYSGWSDFQVKTHIKQLVELEYIYSLTGRKGREYVYELIYQGNGKENNSSDADRKFMIGLADIEEVKSKAEQLGISDDPESSLRSAYLKDDER